MARTPKFSVADVRRALIAGDGIYTAAAQLLDCAPNTVRNYVRKHESLRKICDEIGTVIVDESESQLLKAMRDGEGWAIRYILDRKGQARGWGPTIAVTGKNGGPIQTQSSVTIMSTQVELPDNGRTSSGSERFA